ncbi:MAG: IS1634 family transposase, partial [Acidobacteriaceae bacterium]
KQFAVDEDKIEEEARYDGKWVLTTNMDISPAEVALKYKQLWRVEDVFRSMKSLLDTRPIYHKCDETIRGHAFCSFMALLLRKELEDRLARKGWKLEWARRGPRPGQPGGDGSRDQRQGIRFSRPEFGRDRQGLSSLRCRPAAGAALVPNLTSVRRRRRENVSLRRFKNRNLLKQWNFLHHAVEDEFQTIWQEQCAATRAIHKLFGKPLLFLLAMGLPHNKVYYSFRDWPLRGSSE